MNEKIDSAKQNTTQAEVSISHPQIDEMSRKMVEEKLAGERSSKPTYDRLYELNKTQQEKLRQKQNEHMNEFVKQTEVSMHKSTRANLDQTLY